MERIELSKVTDKNGRYLPRMLGSCSVGPRPWHEDRLVLFTRRNRPAEKGIVCARCGLADPRF